MIGDDEEPHSYESGCRCAGCVSMRLHLDWLLYGANYLIRRADGTIDRVDPASIVIPTANAAPGGPS